MLTRKMLVPLGLIFIGLVVSVMFFDALKTTRALHSRGVHTSAQAFQVRWEDRRGSKSGFAAQVRFTTERGENVETRVDLPRDIGKDMQESGKSAPLDIIYLPEDPLSAELVGGNNLSEEYLWIGGGIISVIVGVIMLLVQRRRVNH